MRLNNSKHISCSLVCVDMPQVAIITVFRQSPKNGWKSPRTRDVILCNMKVRSIQSHSLGSALKKGSARCWLSNACKKRWVSEDAWREYWAWVTHTARIETNYIELWSNDGAHSISGNTYNFYAASSRTSGIEENRPSVFRRWRGQCGWYPNESNDGFSTLWIWIV